MGNPERCKTADYKKEHYIASDQLPCPKCCIHMGCCTYFLQNQIFSPAFQFQRRDRYCLFAGEHPTHPTGHQIVAELILLMTMVYYAEVYPPSAQTSGQKMIGF